MTEEQVKKMQESLLALQEENAKLKAEVETANRVTEIKGLCAKLGVEPTDELLASSSAGEAAIKLISSFKKEPKAVSKAEDVPFTGDAETLVPSATFRQVAPVTGDAPEFAFTTKVEAIKHYKAKGMTAKAAGLHVAVNHNDLPN